MGGFLPSCDAIVVKKYPLLGEGGSHAGLFPGQLQDRASGAQTWRFTAGAECAHRFGEIAQLFFAFRRIAEKRTQRPAQPVRLAFVLDEFRHRLALENEIDQDDVGHTQEVVRQRVGDFANASSEVTVPEAARAASAASKAANFSRSLSTT